MPQQWMQAPKEIREYLWHMWKIPKNGVTEIRDQEVISDGHTYDDLAHITRDRMNDYIGSEETFARAWELTCMKAHSELHPPVGTVGISKEDLEKLAPLVDDTVTDVFIENEPTKKSTFSALEPKPNHHDKETKSK
jgi:hypothetical protein